jgi:hypothetical protein
MKKINLRGKTMKLNQIKKMYKYSLESKHFEVEVLLDYYKEIYNEWDGAPLRKRDLDPDLVDYLDSALDDIPLKYDIDLLLVLPKAKKDKALEDIVKTVIHNYYKYLVQLRKKEINKLYKKALIFTILGFSFLTSSFYLREFTLFSLEIITEGLIIGGWVFLWEALSKVAFESADYKEMVKQYKRYVKANITYEYR